VPEQAGNALTTAVGDVEAQAAALQRLLREPVLRQSFFGVRAALELRWPAYGFIAPSMVSRSTSKSLAVEIKVHLPLD
jgi:hypothetical protein